MREMKKVLSFVLVLALVLSSFSMAFADTTTVNSSALSDIDGLKCEQAVKVLVDLGVITGYTDGTFKPDNAVTRAEAAVIIIKALGLEKSVGVQKSSYTDMSGYAWAEPYIAFASNLGILQGDGNGKYRPGDTVSYNEMAAILVRALGYTPESLTGTWPGNYVNKAAGLGIMDSITSGGNVGATRGDVAQMTANNLTNHIGTIDKDGNFNGTVVKAATTKTEAQYDCFAYRLDCIQETAVITDGDGAVINTMPYLGKYCTYYLNDDKEIIAVNEVKSTTITGDIDSADVNELEGDDDVDYIISGFTYEDTNGNTKGHVEFVNGKYSKTTTSAIAADTKDVVFEAKVSGKTIKEVYSVSKWNVTGHNVVAAEDLTDLADAELLGYDFDTNKDDSINTNSFVLVGVKSLNDIKADNVVYIYTDTNDNKGIIKKVAVGTEIVEGTITKVNDTDKEWKVNGKTYALADQHKSSWKDDQLDNDVKLYLDAYGDIYDFDIVSGSAKDYAVLKDDNGSFGSVKLFLADGTTKTFDLDDDELGGGIGITQYNAFAYSLNKSGQIDKADKESVVSSAAFVSNKVLQVTEGGIAKNYAVDSDVVVFTVNGVPGTTYQDIDVSKVSEVDKLDPKKPEYSTMAICFDDGEVTAVIVDEDIVDGNETDTYAVISKAESATNPAGDKAQELTGYIDGKKMENVFTDSKNVYTGRNNSMDLWKVTVDADGYITKLESVNTSTGALYSASGAGLQYVSDGHLLLGTTSTAGIVNYAIADNAVVYAVEDFATPDIEFSKYTGSIKENTRVWLFNYDDDDDIFDVVVVEK